MVLELVIIALVAIVYFRYTDSSLNLFVWSKLGRQREEIYYHDKVVWLVGGSSGIGEELALRIAKTSAFLILSARRAGHLEAVARKCIEANPDCRVKTLPVDISDLAQLKQRVRDANALWGRKISIVILNAGRSQRAEWTDVDPNVDLECFTLNALAPTQLTRLLLKEQNLHPTSDTVGDLQIVVISSVAGQLPAVLSPSYAAAKSALNAYFRLLAAEMGEKGVKVSIVSPSLVFAPNNPLSAFTDKEGKSNNEVIEKPTQRHMMPDRAAELISLAAMYQIHECIISGTATVLLLSYAYRITPGIVTRIINRIGAAKLRKIRTGTD